MKKVSLNLAGSLGLLSVIGAVAASPTFAETTAVSQINQAMSNDPVAQNVTSNSTQLASRLRLIQHDR